VVPQAAAKKVGEGVARDFRGGDAGGWETAGAVDLAGAGRSEREQVFDVVCKKVLTGDFFSRRAELLRASVLEHV
jgi:hypothetical protein